jgi:hypothetical protein
MLELFCRQRIIRGRIENSLAPIIQRKFFSVIRSGVVNEIRCLSFDDFNLIPRRWRSEVGGSRKYRKTVGRKMSYGVLARLWCGQCKGPANPVAMKDRARKHLRETREDR